MISSSISSDTWTVKVDIGRQLTAVLKRDKGPATRTDHSNVGNSGRDRALPLPMRKDVCQGLPETYQDRTLAAASQHIDEDLICHNIKFLLILSLHSTQSYSMCSLSFEGDIAVNMLLLAWVAPAVNRAQMRDKQEHQMRAVLTWMLPVPARPSRSDRPACSDQPLI